MPVFAGVVTSRNGFSCTPGEREHQVGWLARCIRPLLEETTQTEDSARPDALRNECEDFEGKQKSRWARILCPFKTWQKPKSTLPPREEKMWPDFAVEDHIDSAM